MIRRSSLLLYLVVLFSCEAAAEPKVYRDRVEPHWFAQKSRFWYRNDLPGGKREFVLVDAPAGTRQAAFDHARVASLLADELKRPVAADKLPIDRIEFADDTLSVVLHGERTWRLDLSSYRLAAHPRAAPEAAANEARLSLNGPGRTRRTGAETFVTFVNRTQGDVVLYWLDAEGERRRYARLTPGARHEQHTFGGHVWLATDAQGQSLGQYEAAEQRTTVAIDRPAAPRNPEYPDKPNDKKDDKKDEKSAANERPAARSPDGRWQAELRNHNLVLRRRPDTNPAPDEPENEDPEPLTTDGTETDSYDLKRLWWAPDSSRLVAFRTEKAEERSVHIVESSPRDRLQPKLRTLDYLKPGDRIAHPRSQLFDVRTRRRLPIDESLLPNPWSLDDVRWSADSSRFTFVYNQRGHQVLRLLAVDAGTGHVRTLIEEASRTFVCYSSKFFCRWLGDREVLWMSERDGWNHLWLFDAETGAAKRQVTQGPWVVRNVVEVDERSRQVWFWAGGIRPSHDPYYRHFCRASLDGGPVDVLTEGDGEHSVQWSLGDPYFLDTWSRVDLPPITELRRSSDGGLVCRLEEADADEVRESFGGRWPERFVAKGRDGTTDIYGVILRPRTFDPAKKYAVVENIYAGPHGFFTPKAFRAQYRHQQTLLDRGLIVVQCDGQGTSGRSKAFHDVCWQNLRDAGFPDRIAWLKAAAAKHPELDLRRVGIYGGSAGGQNALAGLLWHGDFYRVAVADCGCHDNRMDKIWWNEQWLGWPVGPQYEANSNLVHADRLTGKLLLIVGELDSNVDPATTLQVAGALQRANKDFDLLLIVGAGHGAAETPYGSRRRAEFLERHLREEEAR